MISGPEMLELIMKRQSDRKYSDKAVEPEKLERILEAGRMAPSACNAQPWKFVVVTDPLLLKEVAEACSAKLLNMNLFVSQAPVIIVIVRENPNFTSKVGSAVKRKDFSHFDVGIAAENVCLQAAAEGIGSCILGWFEESRLKKLLGIPASKRIDLIITLGYSLSEQRTKKRKPSQATVSFNRY